MHLGKGLPIGNLTSQLFANVYMNEFDQFMKRKMHIKHYARYTDDFLIIGNDPDELAKLLPTIRGFLHNSLKLELHPNKIEIRKYRQGIDFLGYVTLPKFRLLRKKTEKRMHRKIRHVISDYKRGTATEERAEATLGSYVGILSHANAHRLSERVRNDFWLRLRMNS